VTARVLASMVKATTVAPLHNSRSRSRGPVEVCGIFVLGDGADGGCRMNRMVVAVPRGWNSFSISVERPKTCHLRNPWGEHISLRKVVKPRETPCSTTHLTVSSVAHRGARWPTDIFLRRGTGRKLHIARRRPVQLNYDLGDHSKPPTRNPLGTMGFLQNTAPQPHTLRPDRSALTVSLLVE
jgi:hypothetical protein